MASRCIAFLDFKRNVKVLFVVMLTITTYFLFRRNRFNSRYTEHGGVSDLVALEHDTITISRFQAAGRALQGREVDSEQGFVLTLEHTGQLIAGLEGITSLQCWLSSLGQPMVLVEPFVVNSSLWQGMDMWMQTAAALEATEDHSVQSSLDSKPHRTLMSLSDYFDMRKFNEYCQKDGRPPLAKLERMWNEAPKSIILVTIKRYSIKTCLAYNVKSMCGMREVSLEEKYSSTSGCPQYEHVTRSVKYLESRGFKVVRSVCLNCESNIMMHFTPTELTKHIFGEFSPTKVTLVISHWKYSYNLSPNCIPCTSQYPRDESVLAHLTPNPKLVEQADSYLKPLGKNSLTKVIAVMIRIEWLLITRKHNTFEEVKRCLSKLLEEHTQLTNSHPGTKTVLALDIGKYGSGTFDNILRKSNVSKQLFSKIVREIKDLVKQVKVDYDDWEESFERILSNTTGSEYLDRGYVAVLQNVIASQADYIIRMGGGHYQLLALQLYKKYHPDVKELQDYIKEVCTKTKLQQVV